MSNLSNFRNKIRWRSFFAKRSENDESNDSNTETEHPDAPPKIKKLTKQAPKSSFPDIETYLANVEGDVFDDCRNKKWVRDNLTSDEWLALNTWRKEVLFNPDSDLAMRLQDKGNRLVIVDKQTDKLKSEQQISKSNFIWLDYDPTEEHISKVSSWASKWHERQQISEEWSKFVVNLEAKPAKNSTLYKTHSDVTPVRPLTAGCNTTIENLAIFVEKHCAPMTQDIKTRIKDTQHLLCIIDDLNKTILPPNTKLVAFDIHNMYPSIDNTRGVEVIRNLLNSRTTLKPSTDCVIEALEICLTSNNSKFAKQNLLQSNGTATGAPNSCSYPDLAVSPIGEKILSASENTFREILYFGLYRDDGLALWVGSMEKLCQFRDFFNSLDPYLKFKMTVGEND